MLKVQAAQGTMEVKRIDEEKQVERETVNPLMKEWQERRTNYMSADQYSLHV
jgi:hypothetical protein